MPAHGLIKLIKLKFSEFNDAKRIPGRAMKDDEGQNVTISPSEKIYELIEDAKEWASIVMSAIENNLCAIKNA